jgi:hypothetical protein
MPSTLHRLSDFPQAVGVVAKISFEWDAPTIAFSHSFDILGRVH